MSEKLIEQFEPALISRMVRLGANTEHFADRDGLLDVYHFRYGGMPSDWRTNLHMALESLSDLDRRNTGGDDIEEVREVIYSIWSAMRRNDNAALKRVLRYAVDQWSPTTLELLEPTTEKDLLDGIAIKSAEAYQGGEP